MNRIPGRPFRALASLAAVVVLGVLPSPVRAASSEKTGLFVRVTDAASGGPIFQARITLEFHEPGSAWKMRRSKWISYSSKTDKKGEYKFVDIPKGPIRLLVTAPGHEAFGHQFELAKDDQVIEIKLRKPQPVL